MTVMAMSPSGTFIPYERPTGLFDTSNPGTNNENRDPDLGSPNSKCTPSGPVVGGGGAPSTLGENCSPQGLVLIIQETNKWYWDDNAGGGIIKFNFTAPVEQVFSIELMDIEAKRKPTTVDVTTSGGVMRTFTAAHAGANSVQTMAINMLDVVQVKVTFGGSGAITDLSLCPRSKQSYGRLAAIDRSALTHSTPASIMAPGTGTPTGCNVAGRKFEQRDAECSAGYYGVENLLIDSSDITSVTSRVKHSFEATLSPIKVWYKNARR